MMRLTADVADKAVSTEDLQCRHNVIEEARKEVSTTARELGRLELVLTALVDSKVIAIKAASSKKARARSLSSGNDGKLLRLTSTSTASSSHQDSPTAPALQHHQQQQQQQQQQQRHHHHHHRRKRQSDSALLSSGLLFPKKRYRGHHHTIRVHDEHKNGHCEDCQNASPILYEEDGQGDLRTKSATNLSEAPFCGVDLSGSRSTGCLDAEEGEGTVAGLYTCQHTSSCHPGYHGHQYVMRDDTTSPSHPQSRSVVSHFDAEYVVLNMVGGTNQDDEEAAKRRKRKQRRRKNRLRRQENEDGVRAKRAKRIDPEDLPKRARWTIIATACLLLLMSVLLVGVTLRMAPIIDEIVRKENEQLMNSLSRDDSLDSFFNASAPVATRRPPTPL